MILADSDIIKYAERGMIKPFNHDLVNPASYDLTLSNELIEITAGGIVDASSRDNFTSQRKIKLEAGQKYLLQPGIFILASSVEYVNIPPELSSEVKLKSTTARRGIGHVYSGWVESGFQGQITFELFSHVPVYLEPGKPVAQIVFLKMYSIPDKTYSGKYQGQIGPTPARAEQLDMFGQRHVVNWQNAEVDAGPTKVVDKLLELDRQALDYWFNRGKNEEFPGLEDTITTGHRTVESNEPYYPPEPHRKAYEEKLRKLADDLYDGHVVADMDSLTLRIKEDFSDSFDKPGYTKADSWEDDNEPGIL